MENMFAPRKSNVQFSEGQKSKGLLEENPVKKSIRLKQGTIEHIPANDPDIANKKYVDDNVGTGDVTAGSNLTDIKIVQGDGGAKGIKTSNATVTQVIVSATHSASDGSDHSIVVANQTHAADSSQAHSDYLLNSAVDIGVQMTLTGD